MISAGLPDIFRQLKYSAGEKRGGSRINSGRVNSLASPLGFPFHRAPSSKCTRFGSTLTISGERNAPRWL